ncbi:glutamate--cysteine ligase [Buchnera aphidicola (Rhopalosiphum padi)]|uniref:Glutamate--cysteine ligase n=1 Tax=Buchnera aphidicola subsp. Rhopalosiphum padi TaxID=98793 RepID=A0A4D6YHD0_BUCRP|nr:glutamate--cysteine ligase [Buchnera aphidicola]QCI25038.1 glutamate--cysteine ligase [Buchnera aphidicola (Rhopalosiphum padi)]
MIEDISKKIAWLKNQPVILKDIFRGIERETLRIEKNGNFSNTKHPYLLGSSLTHKWITTDFSENLLEFITPTSNSINYLLNFLNNLHSFVAYNIQHERMWPFSIPYLYDKSTTIKIAQYGNSRLGKIKSLYRKGLKNRYGDLVNTISGIHYNFSLPKIFWKNRKKYEKNSDYISCGYLNLIRNYYRFGWVITYLFGASPAISKHFLKNKKHEFKENIENILYLPWSTSLRLSDIGYTKTPITELNIMFNDLKSYIESLHKAINTPSKKFSDIGIKNKKGEFLQLNTNILQMESELYTLIRPKRKTNPGESLLEALGKRGIEYVEIRSLDINPFSSIGINKKQILILDLFLIWCALINAPKMNKENFLVNNKNWDKIILEGRKPNQKIYINSKYETKTLIEIGETIFQDLKKIAKILDDQSKNFEYQQACQETMLFFKNPELTYSAQFLKLIIKNGIKKTGLDLANKYHKQFINKFHYNSDKNILERETIRSHKKQKQIENNEILSKKTISPMLKI